MVTYILPWLDNTCMDNFHNSTFGLSHIATPLEKTGAKPVSYEEISTPRGSRTILGHN